MENQEASLKDKRPKVGIGIVVYNDNDEILVGQRTDDLIGTYQFPGGHLEYSETFEGCSARELAEETNITLPESEFKYVTTINVRRTDKGYHNVGIIMSVKVSKYPSPILPSISTQIS